MKTIDFSPLYRSSIGFDRVASLLDASLNSDPNTVAYPPYNIEVLDENRYEIALAVAGFDRSELDIQIEKGVLTVAGKKADDKKDRQYLYRGIANRSFERRFNLADHIEVVDAKISHGLLTIDLVKEIPEAMKPKSITINESTAIEHNEGSEAA
ncbi:Hsp20 family protein [Oceanicoccus sp. KOV_DT_Chl]|uniref:Hsp20 family protein n=1 Tax=Oceanicoccus sp. KOV_DT_Chl TaxID=1904639 RepID=UPI000C7A7F21|nr:Hsp20 family protein [Oceanicoccus sp. KOV_DT_Chl]